MKIKLLFALLFYLLLLSCNHKAEKSKPKITTQKETELNFDGFPVYSISKNIDAITFELDNYEEETLFYNKIYHQVVKEDTLFVYNSGPIKSINSTQIDTSETFKIFKSAKLEERIKSKLKSSYYVYGTKGFTKVTLGNVYFTVDECISNIIAVKIIGFDKEKYGSPLICTEKPINLVYGNDYKKVEKKINKEENRLKQDYYNPPNTTKVYGNIGSNYFTYQDDFGWKKEFNMKDVNFPSRAIYVVNSKGKVDNVWGKGLDLFGISCD